MENKNKKKGLIIGVIAIVIIAILAIVYFAPKEQPQNTTPVVQKDDCVNGCELVDDPTPEAKTNKFNITYSGETVKYNAYDFIIEKMSQAQYWTYDQYHPLYRIQPNGFAVSKEQTIANATGWDLYDEKTASFVRGCQGRLIINFSNNTANSDPSFYSDTNELSGSNILEPTRSDLSVIEYDYNNEQYKRFVYANDTESTNFDSEEEYRWVNEPYWEINRTIQFYNDVFEEVGIPLLNQPEGTLTQYKNKTINVPIELVELKYSDRWGDDLIHSPFDERVGWNWYWEKDTDNVWISDYRDVLNKQFPESSENEMIQITYKDEEYQLNKFAPVFLCLADKKQSKIYGEEEGFGLTQYYNNGGAFVTYYLKPIYKEIFGFNGVYFCEENTLPGGNDITNIMTSEKFNSGIKVMSDISYLMSIHNKGDFTVGYEMDMAFPFGIDDFNEYINELLEHYNVQNIYGKDFLQYLTLLYSVSTQKELGLR